MRLHTKKYKYFEKIHHLDEDIVILSFFNKFFFKRGDAEIQINLPTSFIEKIFGMNIKSIFISLPFF